MGRTRRELWEAWNLQYFDALPTYRRLKRTLSYAAAFAAVGWIAWTARRHDESPYSSGRISVGHLAFADECMRCHTAGRGYTHFLDSEKSRDLNKNCLVCHGITLGHDPKSNTAWHQVSSSVAPDPLSQADGGERTLACAGCHVEHEGYERLVDMSDHQCVRCHADLTRHMSQLDFADHISTFYEDRAHPEQNHPEFRILERKTADPGRLRFNHQHHLNPKGGILNKSTGEKVALRCDDCHRAGLSTVPWRYGSDVPHAPSRTSVTDSELALQQDYMDPINYNLHCSDCHFLTVANHADQLRGHETAPKGGVPHTTPAAIRTYLRGELSAYINDPRRTAASIETKERTPLPKFAGKPADEVERLKLEWIEREVQAIESRLYSPDAEECAHCHEIQPPATTDAAALPRIVRPDIPRRWFTSASFSHERHKALPGPPLESTGWANCLKCHEDVLDSAKTSDVLLPGINTCRRCHAPRERRDGVHEGGVSHSCVFCHTYHRPPIHRSASTVAVAGSDAAP